MIQVANKTILNQYILAARTRGISIGFVPTMGALHEGHLSLVRASKRGDGLTVVSIFVNPTQFNDPKDYNRYPRNLGEDLDKVKQCLDHKDIVFTPDKKEVYPSPDTRVFDLDPLDKVMEGKYRPGHFNGVAQVVSRLFDMVKPDNAYFGSKDFQQVAVIKRLVNLLKLPVNIISCPTVRENDGLAMSSRNKLLSTETRKEAPLVYSALKEVAENTECIPINQLKKRVEDIINKAPNLTLEYFEIVHQTTLQPINTWEQPGPWQACIAVWAKDIRLIDNIPLPAGK